MRKATFVLLIASLISSLSKGQDNCSGILKYGIFDLTTIKSEDDFSSQFIDWFSSSNYSSTSNIEEAGFGIGIDGVGANLSSTTGNTSTSKAEFTHKIQNDVNKKQMFQGDFKKANPNIINAWSSCAANKVGLIASAIRIPGSGIIKVRIQVKKKSDGDRLDTLKITDFIYSKHLSAPQSFAGKKLSETNINDFYFEVDSADFNKALYFQITTNISGYAATVDLIGLRKVSIIKITSDNLKDMNKRANNMNDLSISRALREYFSMKANDFKIAFPNTPYSCYESEVGVYDMVINLIKKYQDEVAKNNGKENDSAIQNKAAVDGLLSQMEALINARVHAPGLPCSY